MREGSGGWRVTGKAPTSVAAWISGTADRQRERERERERLSKITDGIHGAVASKLDCYVLLQV